MHILGLPATETPTSAQKLLGNLDFNQSPKALYEQISTIAPWSNRLIAAIADYENVAGEHAFNVLSVLAGRIEEHYAENFSLPPGALGKATRQFLDTVRQIHSSVTHRI